MDNSMKSETSQTPIQCANKCGFFGTAATMNLCSKCYKDYQHKESQTVTLKSAVGKSLMLSAEEETRSQTLLSAEKTKAVVSVSTEEIKKTTTTASTSRSNRCGCCNKKVGVVGFKCRCGSTFCGAHRYPEEHKCEFDHKVAGRVALAKANPLVVADKLQRI